MLRIEAEQTSKKPAAESHHLHSGNSMRQHLKAFLVTLLTKAYAFPTPMTDPSGIHELLKKLRPVSPPRPLVRLGPNGDGGYLIPADLSNIAACFSPGVSGVSGFEKACANQGMKVFLADKSVDGPAEPDAAFHFSKKFLGATSNDDFMTLDAWVEASLPDRESELLLQMDIEGQEYEVFLSASEALMKRFRIIVVEFHLLDQLWSKPFFRLASPAFEKLLQTHACVHIHPNNCRRSSVVAGIEIPPVMEFTFLRIDRMSNSRYRNDFPHSLDCHNTGKASLPLPKCWYAMFE